MRTIWWHGSNFMGVVEGVGEDGFKTGRSSRPFYARLRRLKTQTATVICSKISRDDPLEHALTPMIKPRVVDSEKRWK